MENSPEIPSEEPRGEIPTELPAVVVLGSGFQAETPPGGPDRLDQWARMRVLAAGMMFTEGLVGPIILTGGRLFKKDSPSVAQSMKDYLLLKFPQIPEDSIILEEESVDTSENAENVTQILRERKIPSAIVLTDEPHLPRAKKLFENYGAEVLTGASAQEKLKTRSKHGHHQKFVERLRQSKEFEDFAKREQILNKLLWIDPHGKIPRFLARNRKPKAKE